MPLQYEPQFAKAFEPILEMLKTRPLPALHDVKTRRTNLIAMFGSLLSQLPATPDVEQSWETCESADGTSIRILVIRKKERSATPTAGIVHFHGGGMIAGETEMFGQGKHIVVSQTGIPHFSVDYRLAPEVKGTTLAEDCYAGVKWVSENAERFGVDKTRLAVMGESAGGGLAAGVAVMARDRGLSPALKKQVLIYPMLDDRNLGVKEEIEPLATWRREDNVTGWTAVLGDEAGKEGTSEYISALRVKDTKGLPSTYIDAGDLDLFRDEDIEYGLRLAKANVPLEMHIYPGVPHAFEAFAPQIDVTQRALQNRLKAIMSL